VDPVVVVVAATILQRVLVLDVARDVLTGPPSWPDGARFAFTVFDDTDFATLETAPPVYDLLTDLGMRVTKSVWPVAARGPVHTTGSTCAEPDYLAWVLKLQEAGHEIGYHNATDHSSTRAETIAALDRFRDLFGHDPRTGADHSGNLEAVCWGPDRLTGLRSRAYAQALALARPGQPVGEGAVPSSPYFWADVLRDRVDYWRNFSFHEIDTLAACPAMPYHDPRRPYVNRWFAGSHAPHREPFLDLVTPAALDRLEASGGACIIYTHFGVEFAEHGRLDPRFVRVMEDLAARRGWFVPVATLLDHLRTRPGHPDLLTDRARARLENRWVLDHLRTRTRTELRKARARRAGHPE
jgi:hypothetical protein